MKHNTSPFCSEELWPLDHRGGYHTVLIFTNSPRLSVANVRKSIARNAATLQPRHHVTMHPLVVISVMLCHIGAVQIRSWAIRDHKIGCERRPNVLTTHDGRICTNKLMVEGCEPIRSWRKDMHHYDHGGRIYTIMLMAEGYAPISSWWKDVHQHAHGERMCTNKLMVERCAPIRSWWKDVHQYARRGRMCTHMLMTE
jgi:hypothetical protein